MSYGPTPTISHILADGTIIELLYDPARGQTGFAVRWPDGRVSMETEVRTGEGEVLIPYSPKNNLIVSGCVKLPSTLGEDRDYGDLVDDVRAFIRRYVDLTPLFEVIATYYVLLSWLYDAFNELPYLRFRGDYGTGKTRALLVVGSLCNKGFFASGASTVSPIFHVLDAFGATLVLDEADLRFSDATAELTKILNNGNMRGLPVLRTMSNRHRELSPTAFKVYGPKVIAMRQSFADLALESRFLTEETGGRQLRDDIPIHLGKEMEREAQLIRDRLLTFRLTHWTETKPKPDRIIHGVEPRLNQTALALLSVIEDAVVRNAVASELLGVHRSLSDERSVSEEGVVLAALIESMAKASGNIPISALPCSMSALACEDDAPPLSSRRIGWIIRTRLHLSTRKSNGVYVVPQTEFGRIRALARRFGVAEARRPD